MKMPTITVVVPTFNRLGLLKRTMKSIRNLSPAPDEIVVVDYHSEDVGVVNYLTKIEGINLHINKKNLGDFENMAEGIKLAKSDYVIICQADDLMLPDAIGVYKEKMQVYGSRPGVYITGGFMINELDAVTGKVMPFKNDMYMRPPRCVKEFWNHCWFNLLIGGWTAYRRDVFDRVGFWGRKYGRIGENEMSMKILPRYDVCFIAKPTFAYRVHSAQLGANVPIGEEYARGINESRDSARVLYDFERDQLIIRSFTPYEKQKRVFVRKPLAYFLCVSIFFLSVGNVTRAKKFFDLFMEVYPKPIFSKVTAVIFFQWMVRLGHEYLVNLWLRVRYRDKPIHEIMEQLNWGAV